MIRDILAKYCQVLSIMKQSFRVYSERDYSLPAGTHLPWEDDILSLKLSVPRDLKLLGKSIF